MGDLSPSLSPNCHGHNHPSEQQQSSTIGFNAMVIMAAMVCALVCALGLNSTLQCVFQCTYRALTEPRQWLVSRRQNSGLKKKEVVALPTSTFENNNSGNSPSSSASASGTSCAICLVDFIDGDKIRLLPKCNHRFHIACIDKWLFSHSSCPTCRHRLKNSNGSLPSLDQIVVTPL